MNKSHILRFFVRVFRRISRLVKPKRKKSKVHLRETDVQYSSLDQFIDYPDDKERRG